MCTGHSEAKIDQHEAILLLVQNQICRLDIAMQQLVSFQLSQEIEQLPGILPPGGEWEREARLQLQECLPGDILHLEMDIIGGL